MSETVNWGVLGAADFAREHMAPAIHMARGARLAALATSHPDKAGPFRAFCPDLRVHDSYAALLADPAIEAVYIPLPNSLHVEWTEKALDAGKHVLCEKPIALRAGDIDRLIARRDATGLLAAEAYMIVHHPQWARIRKLIETGAIGDLQHVNGVFTYDNSDDPDNIRNHRDTGGGGIPDIGVYPFGATRLATGHEPEDISARIAWENGVDVRAEVNARFGEASFFALLSMRMQRYQEMTFQGTAGHIRVTAPFNPGVYGEARVEWRSGSDLTRVEHWPRDNQYVTQVENFCHSIRSGAPFPWRLEDARGTQMMIDRVFAAAG